MEVWIIGQPDAFTLEAKSKKSKDEFASELRKVIAKEKVTGTKDRLNRIVRNVVSNEALSATSGSDSSRQGGTVGRSAFSRARSLDGESWSRTYQDSGGSSGYSGGYMDRSSSVEQLDVVKYRALADYTALTGRELNLHTGEVVELVRVGCAGWWYVRLHHYPFTEGWAPSTYLEKMSSQAKSQSVSGRNKNRNRTLDRF